MERRDAALSFEQQMLMLHPNALVAWDRDSQGRTFPEGAEIGPFGFRFVGSGVAWYMRREGEQIGQRRDDGIGGIFVWDDPVHRLKLQWRAVLYFVDEPLGVRWHFDQ